MLGDKVDEDGHSVVEHEDLLQALTEAASNEEKAERLKAIQALRHARLRKEGLADWKFDISGVARKDVITWAYRAVQGYFRRL